MDDEYRMNSSNLHHYINERPLFTSQVEMNATPFDNVVMMMNLHSHHSTTINSSNGVAGGLEIDGRGGLGGDAGTARWPRQETLSLLEIRSKLDAKFKETNQKGPLWDELSRIMYEEHGYQRSGKKCREKFENLYKYYKKTKEGKAGRQDGKHYRFFRQLEALYGETTTSTTTNNNYNYPLTSTSNPHCTGTTSFRYNDTFVISNNNKNQELFNQHQEKRQSEETSLRLSNSSDYETSSSEDSENSSSGGKRKKRSKRGWKTKIKDFIDAQMSKLMVTQEALLEKMMKTIEHKEQERMMREETWKKQEEERIEKEHKFWDKKRALIEAKDRALMETLHKLAGKEIVPNDNASESITNLARGGGESSWQEFEITRLIQLRSLMEARFVEQVGCGEIIWEEISAKMASFGYDKSPLTCKNKWESINDHLMMCQKRGKESSASCGYFQGNDHSISHQQYSTSSRGRIHDHVGGNSPPNCTTALNISDNCFRYLMGNADNNNFWENYGVKLCKGDSNNDT